MTFQDLNLNKALWNALVDLGLETPTKIQSEAFPVIMSGKDVIGVAQTGTGKTFAYLLPILRLWSYDKTKVPKVLIIVPTRELVVQVVEAIESLTTYMNARAVGVYGGTNIRTQKGKVAEGYDIVVGTPGRTMDMLLDGVVKPKAIKKLVIDEMDELLNLGFRTQLKNILDLLNENRQNLLFSATLTEEVEALINDFFQNTVKVEAAPTGTPLENIEQSAYNVPNFNTKVNFLKLLLNENEEMSKVLVFVSTKKLADLVFERLEEDFGERLGIIHSNKAQNNRFNTVKEFHAGTIRALIATDIVARGIDVSEVTHVINFDVPAVPENYMHRIGRTGRADKNGIAISFVTDKERVFQEQLEELMNQPIPIIDLPENLEISTELIPHEMPTVAMPNMDLKMERREPSGPAFHEKKDKNKKENRKVRYVEKMKAKYKRPIRRKPKKKSKKN